jgi:SnoaL-like domain
MTLARLIDTRAIERIVYDYAYFLDMNMPVEMAALFVDDCEVSYAPNFGAIRIEAYKKTLDGIGSFFKGTSHHVSNVCVDFTSDTQATVRAVVLAIHRYTKDRPDGTLYGQYHDIVVKQGGHWKFKTRILKTTLATDYHVKTANPIGRTE